MRKGQKKEVEPKSRHEILYSSLGAFDSFQKKSATEEVILMCPLLFSTNALIPVLSQVHGQKTGLLWPWIPQRAGRDLSIQ